MAQCTFKLPFPDASAQHIHTVRKAIEGAGGTFKGTAMAGNFFIPIGIGNIEGNYAVADDEITILITKKPFVVTCGIIEARMKSYMPPGV